MESLLAWWVKYKKEQHSKNFLEQRIFYPFVLSVDGMLVKEVLVVLTIFSRLVAVKMEEPISNVCV